MLDLLGPRQHGLQVAVFGDQLGRRLDADAGDTGHVVGRIPGQGLHLDHLVGADAEFLHHLLGPDFAALHGVQHDHAVADQLHQVLVRRDDGDLGAGFLGLTGIGGDQVVGLEAVHVDAGDAEGRGRLADEGELGNQFVRRRRPVGLVFGIDVAAKGLAGAVEHHRHVVGVGIGDKLHHHAREAEDRIDRRPVGAGHRRQGMEGAEDETGTVDQEDVLGLG